MSFVTNNTYNDIKQQEQQLNYLPKQEEDQLQESGHFQEPSDNTLASKERVEHTTENVDQREEKSRSRKQSKVKISPPKPLIIDIPPDEYKQPSLYDNYHSQQEILEKIIEPTIIVQSENDHHHLKSASEVPISHQTLKDQDEQLYIPEPKMSVAKPIDDDNTKMQEQIHFNQKEQFSYTQPDSLLQKLEINSPKNEDDHLNRIDDTESNNSFNTDMKRVSDSGSMYSSGTVMQRVNDLNGSQIDENSSQVNRYDEEDFSGEDFQKPEEDDNLNLSQKPPGSSRNTAQRSTTEYFGPGKKQPSEYTNHMSAQLTDDDNRVRSFTKTDGREDTKLNRKDYNSSHFSVIQPIVEFDQFSISQDQHDPIEVEHRGSSFHKNRDASAIQRNDTINESENHYNGQIDGADSQRSDSVYESFVSNKALKENVKILVNEIQNNDEDDLPQVNEYMETRQHAYQNEEREEEDEEDVNNLRASKLNI